MKYGKVFFGRLLFFCPSSTDNDQLNSFIFIHQNKDNYVPPKGKVTHVKTIYSVGYGQSDYNPSPGLDSDCVFKLQLKMTWGSSAIRATSRLRKCKKWK